MRIVFFGTSNVALPVLEELSRSHEMAAVVTAPDAAAGRNREFRECPVSVLAGEMKLKILKPDRVKGNDILRLELSGLNPDIFVVVSYGYILPEEIINLPPLKTVNVHFSLLPKYRGAAPIQYALLNGERETGTTIFILDKEMDHGPILAQGKLGIDDDDNYITLGDKLARLSAKLIIPTLEHYAAGQVRPQEQDHDSATYTKIISKQDGKIDWNKSAWEIYNQFRAFYPWPGIWTTWEGKMLKIIDCMATELRNNANLQKTTETGTVLEGGVVACGQNTYLQINSLQLEGKKETNIADFLNGYRQFVGRKLG